MRNWFLGTVGALVLFGTSIPSQAADLGARIEPIYQRPAIVPAPIINPWTGLYAGFNAGYGFERFGSGDMPGVSTGDGSFGVQGGYNWLANNWLFGVEADIQATTGHLGKASGTCGGVPCTTTARINGFGTLRGRVGMMLGGGLVYVTGGGAFIDTGAGFFPATGEASTGGTWRPGYALGVGYEQMLWDRWSGKIEYLYLAAQGPSLSVAGLTGAFDTREHLLRAGINYHF